MKCINELIYVMQVFKLKGKGDHVLVIKKEYINKIFNKILSIKKLRFNSLQVILSFVMLGLSLTAVLVISLIICVHANKTINHSINQNNVQIVGDVTNSIDSYISEMESISDTIADLLVTEPVESLNSRTMVFLREDIQTIAVFDETRNAIFCTDNRKIRDDLNLTRQSWFTGATVKDSQYLLSVPHVQRLFRGSYPWVITMTRGVSWTQQGVVHNGIIMVDMNFSCIKDLCTRNLENNGYLYVVGNDNDIIYHPMQQMIYAGIIPNSYKNTSQLKDGTKEIANGTDTLAVAVKTLSRATWRVVGVSTLKGLDTYGGDFKKFIIISIVVLFVALFVASIVVSRGIVKPLRQLGVLMGRVSGDDEVICAPEKGVFEVRWLSSSFNKMVKRVNQLMNQVKNEQEQLRKSELKTLYSQINPHFLYNTLDSVVWLAKSGDDKNVVNMVMALAKFFRMSLSGGRESITVKEELQQVENYLIIQQMRFNNSFTYEITYEDDVINAITPKIVLQPLVENAIVHGMGTLGESGVITITAKKLDKLLVFEVKDNGCGIPPNKLEHLLKTRSKSTNGFGLKNVHERIRLACGLKYGLEIESIPDEETTVRVILPFQFEDKHKEVE